MSDEDVLGVLRRAVGIIDERGWLQGGMGDADGPVCVVGALAEASRDVPGDVEHRYSVEFRAAARVRRRVGTSDLVQWNDDPMRTKEDVITALRSATE